MLKYIAEGLSNILAVDRIYYANISEITRKLHSLKARASTAVYKGTKSAFRKTPLKTIAIFKFQNNKSIEI
jgi:hypothetical protein